MIETKVEIPGIGVEALLLRPDNVADFPGVVFLTDIWGIRPANIDVAKRLSERGFSVLMPNVFHRYSRMTPDGFEHGSQEERTKALHALFAALTPQNMVDDGMAYVDFLLAQKGVKKGGASAGAGSNKAGVVGYCFAGQMAIRIAAAMPDKIAAAASFHGGFWSRTRRTARTGSWGRSRRGFILVMRRRTPPQRPNRSKLWKQRCATGTAHSRANSMRVRFTVGRCPAVTFTMNCRPSAPSRSWSGFLKRP